MPANKFSLGASEIGTVLGINQHQTARELWAIKTGRLEAGPISAAAQDGLDFEDGVLRKWVRETGAHVLGSQFRAVHLNGIAHATLDLTARTKDGVEVVVDAKFSSPLSKAWNGRDVPAQYVAQVRWQIEALRSLFPVKYGELAVWHGNFKRYRIEPDQEWFERVVPIAREFLECVRTQTELPEDFEWRASDANRKKERTT